MEPLPPIPTPLGQRWREFRIQILPVLFFIGLVAALVLVWRNYLIPISMVGEVEAIKANATSLMDGTLVQLSVDRFSRVTNGQVLGRIETANPAFLSASLAAIDYDLKVLKAQLDLDRVRNLDTQSRLKLDLLTEQINLNLAKIRQVQVEKEFDRTSLLFKEGIIPGGFGVGIAPNERDVTGYDVALRDRDSVRAEVEDRAKLVMEWQKELQRLEAMGTPKPEGPDTLIEESIRAKERELQQTYAPVELIAPIDGVVSVVYRRLGERVVRGEPLITISAHSSERIIGYMRQPIGQVPSVADTVMVRTRARGLRSVEGEGRVLEVGVQLEPINPALISMDSNRIEMGLPILISLPQTLKEWVRPGQIVDLAIKQGKKG